MLRAPEGVSLPGLSLTFERRVPVPRQAHHPAVAGVCVCHHPAQALNERGLSFFVVTRW